MKASVRGSRKAGGKVERIDAQPAFVLHQYPYRETSKLLDVFSRDYGRLMIVARGAQRPGSQLRGVLLAFQPVLMSWFGAGDVKTLHVAEWQGGSPQLVGLPLLCGFYLNELLMKLLQRDEPRPTLFVAYFDAIRALTTLKQGQSVEPILRSFELGMLADLGVAPDWLTCVDGTPVDVGSSYAYLPANGIVPSRPGLPSYDGQTLLDVSKRCFSSERALAQTKILMRQAFAEVLGDLNLHTRQLLLDLQQL
ncbi:DNA repair protein RecO [Andreprevotia chitinilytica]|uniref:DNA repair protein RecO n=1 Tax=Andreprevotia chitinilytica TaxID=396808 RepID=UPI00054D4A48|nr:DNA repair protein RecO [Andreprevotia chitinilytica]